MRYLPTRELIIAYGSDYRLCKNSRLKSKMCSNPSFLESVCKMKPTSIFKFVRLSIEQTSSLFDEASWHNHHVIFLTRDPRAVMNSRWKESKTSFCIRRDCYSAKLFCKDTLENMQQAILLKKKHPGRVHIVRYEDISMNPKVKIKKLVTSLGLGYTSEIDKYINSHMNIVSRDSYGIRTNISSGLVSRWTKDITLTNVQTIENTCTKSMEMSGYKPLYEVLRSISSNISNIMSAPDTLDHIDSR